MRIMVSEPQLREAVANSKSIAGVLRYLGKNDRANGQHTAIKRRIEKLGIDTSHFTGQGWSKSQICYKTEEVFAEGSRSSRSIVRRYIIRDKLIPYECAFCGNTGEWLGRPMALELDHINGVFNDHRLENLRFLCPNCHAITDTYCGKNVRDKKEKVAEQSTPDDNLQNME